jgi:trehalose/maltose transport system permease protein
MERARRRMAWLFLLPTLVLLAAVAGWPLLRTGWLAFTDAHLARPGETQWVGLENYGWLLTDPDWWRAVANTLVFTVISVSAQLLLGLGIALVLAAQFRGRGLLRAAVLIPWAIPTVVSAQMWAWMYNDVYGVFNALLVGLGVLSEPVPWLAEPVTAMAAVIFTDTWKATPFMALLLLAGLQTIPGEVYEAAQVDGAGRWRRLVFVTLPLLRPAMLVALVFRTLDALRVFDLIYVMTSNSRDTATMAVYARQQLIDFQETGYGATVSMLIFVIIALVTAGYMALMRVDLAGER